MKKFILEYLSIIGYTITGLLFAYSAFYLLINLYHEKELDRGAQIIVKEDVAYNSVSTKIQEVKNNINSFSSSNYKGDVPVHILLTIQGRLQNCTTQFENETFKSFEDKTEFSVEDVEKLRQSFQNNILSTCLVEQLYDLAVANQSDRFPINSLKTIAPYVELNIKNLLAANNYLTVDLLNNNVYYFTTEHTHTNLVDKTKLSYAELVSSYNRAADLLLELSKWFKQEVNG